MRLSRMILGLGLMLSALVFTGAVSTASAAKPKLPTYKGLLGKQYKSVTIKGNSVLKSRTLGLNFVRQGPGPKQPTMRISGGCNAMGANFRVRNGRLSSVGPFSGTKMACKPDPDPWIRSKFKAGLKVRVAGNRLILSRPAEGVKMVFRRVAEKENSTFVKPGNLAKPDREVQTDPAVIGEPATVESLLDKSYESTDVIGRDLAAPIKVSFFIGKANRSDDHGKQIEAPLLTARLGCNWMGGEFSVEDGKLTWVDVISTLMACQNSSDGWFHDLVAQGVDVTQLGSTLTLTSGKTQITFEQVP